MKIFQKQRQKYAILSGKIKYSDVANADMQI